MFDKMYKGAVLAEVKTYKYVVAGETMAKFEILLLEDGSIGSQGTLIKDDLVFSPGKFYETKEKAIQDTINYIDEAIEDDEWIIKSQKVATEFNF